MNGASRGITSGISEPGTVKAGAGRSRRMDPGAAGQKAT